MARAIDGGNGSSIGPPFDAHPVVFLAKQSSRVCVSRRERNKTRTKEIGKIKGRKDSKSIDTRALTCNRSLRRGSIERNNYFLPFFSLISKRGRRGSRNEGNGYTTQRF